MLKRVRNFKQILFELLYQSEIRKEQLVSQLEDKSSRTNEVDTVSMDYLEGRISAFRDFFHYFSTLSSEYYDFKFDKR